MAEPPFLIAEVLPLAVSLNDFRLLLPSSPPVVGVPSPPLLHALTAHLPILRIVGESAKVIVAAAVALASRTGADGLLGPVLRGLENLLTIAAAPFFHASVVAPTAQSFRTGLSSAGWGRV